MRGHHFFRGCPIVFSTSLPRVKARTHVCHSLPSFLQLCYSTRSRPFSELSECPSRISRRDATSVDTQIFYTSFHMIAPCLGIFRRTSPAPGTIGPTDLPFQTPTRPPLRLRATDPMARPHRWTERHGEADEPVRC